MTTPKTVLKRARVALLIGAFGGCIYLATRFTILPLPAEGCSPVSRFAAGDRLLVDSRPRPLVRGDAVLARDDRGVLQLTLVERVREEDGALWCGGNNAECPGFDSETAGWIPRESVAGRVLLGWSL